VSVVGERREVTNNVVHRNGGRETNTLFQFALEEKKVKDTDERAFFKRS
jgi:hypothetical protein